MKRSADCEGTDVASDTAASDIKQVRLDHPNGAETAAAAPVDQKRAAKKAIVMLMYSGTGYFGMQRNPGFQTIEGTLFDCLFAGGHINRAEHACPAKLQFQRASKTDKGVSALAQVASLWLDLSNPEELKADLASRLPPEIRLLDIFRTTRSFNCKAKVNHREYVYICPSYTFASKSRPIDIGYRIDAKQLALLSDCLAKYKGTKNFYNFTSGRPTGDPSCNRYILDFTVSEPFLYRDAEFVELAVKGQSFMLHQIRKMVGLAVAVAKGYCDLASMDAVFTYRRMDVPKSPGLGLLLSKIDYSAYNGKYALELGYPTIEWDRYEALRREFKSTMVMPEIYRGEVEDKSMLEWLKTLTMHSYDFCRKEGPSTSVKQQESSDPVNQQESSDLVNQQESSDPANQQQQDLKDSVNNAA